LLKCHFTGEFHAEETKAHSKKGDEVGGWPELKSKPAPKDADRDGMGDTWETANNLDPKDPADRNGDADKDGYTNLEEYLNSLCSQPPKD
jgi:hypothetical protein